MSTPLSPHFTAAEFRCKDGSEHAIDQRLIDMLEAVRAHFGRPVSITSGYRSPAWNKQVGGATQSYHCRGMAADIQVEGVPAAAVSAWCAVAFPRAGVGAYASWTHVDCRGYRARWGFPAHTVAARGFVGPGEAAAETPSGVLIASTKWTLARGLIEIAVGWAWRALRDWRVSPEELLDLARQLLDFAAGMQHEAEGGAPR